MAAAPLAPAAPARGEIVGAAAVTFLPDGPGADRAVFATHAPGRPDDLFIVQQSGRIHRLDLSTGQLASQLFLDINTLVDDGGNEQGMLGLAFHPDYATNGYFYVNYTRDPGPGLDRTRVDRFQATNPLTATTVSVSTRSSVLEFEQDFSNHNGGWIGFSPRDEYLYIASGDGGSGNDPNNRGQSLNTRLGKILRVDVDGDDFPLDATENYRVPNDNPFVGASGALDEIWAYGLRNPWRASFDRETGDFWIGDVGQGAREEINFQRADSGGGENYGWRLREGDIQTPGSVGGPEPSDHVAPIYDYASDGRGDFGGNSTVGGYVYRGPDPEAEGLYFFGDSIPTQFWTRADDGTVDNINPLLNPSDDDIFPVSFAEDAAGNLYYLASGSGVYRIETDALRAGDYNADGVVDGEDFLVWREEFGAADSLADGNGDGVVNAADYTVWRDNLSAESQASQAASPAPEPPCVLLAPLLALAGRRRHRGGIRRR